MDNSNGLYDDGFYERQVSGSYRSARVFAGLIAAIFTPKSVVDFGCGRGTWLKAFKEIGATTLVGFDGEWNSQANMIEGSIVFNACDLNKGAPGDRGEKFELAISLEVAEHLEPSSAGTVVQSLVSLSDVVLFSAAFPGQGGTNHINEQPHSYWARLFATHNYVPFDVFRPVVWGDTRVRSWYRRNAFLYVRSDSAVYKVLRARKMAPLKNAAFMDCVDPALFLAKLPFWQKARLIPRMLAGIRRRFVPATP
jgi:hypothetical protein